MMKNLGMEIFGMKLQQHKGLKVIKIILAKILMVFWRQKCPKMVPNLKWFLKFYGEFKHGTVSCLFNIH